MRLAGKAVKRAFVLLVTGLLVSTTAIATDMADDGAEEAIAGRYFGTLPDRACASLDILLTLDATGRYDLQSHCQDDLQSWAHGGAWSVTWNGTCVQLAPATHAAPSYEFAMHDDGLLALATGSCVEPVDDPRGRSLRRVRAAQPED